MSRLLRDRYLAIDATRLYDLVTAKEVTAASIDAGGVETRPAPLPSLRELLDHGRDGEPRWIVAGVGHPAQAAATTRRVAAAAQRSGVVAMSVDAYLRFRDLLAEDLAERTLLLVAGSAGLLPAARAALLDASARSPRPHVLLTFQTNAAAARQPRQWLVREARAAYGQEVAVRRPPPRSWPSDVLRHAAAIGRAVLLADEGRHAVAERMLRECTGALMRRQASAVAVDGLIALGRLLLERGRARDADACFADAAAQAQMADDEMALLGARLWQGAARCDAGRVIEAESICRAVRLAGARYPGLSAWAHASLVRVLLLQGRPAEEAPGAGHGDTLEELDAPTRAFIDAVAVKALVRGQRLFEAGQRARRAVEAAHESKQILAAAIAHTAHLRVLADAGDLTLAAAAFAQVASFATRGHTPLRLARARLVWHDALRRAGRLRDADRQLECLTRVRRAAPASLRRAIDRRLAGRASPAPPVFGCRANGGPVNGPRVAAASAISLVHVAHDADDDAEAVRAVLTATAKELQASRVELVSCDAGPITAIVTIGNGLATHLGSRILDAGVAIGPTEQESGREFGVPVRLGTRLLAAVVARWPLDRQPPSDAGDLLQLAAAVAAPRVEQQLRAARLTAAAATNVPELVGVSSVMLDVRRAIVRAAAAPFNILVEGESGTGKELAARAVHHLSARRERRFCDVNCAAIPEELLDAELFGHARGAFTGAVADHAGLFEEADGGTLFLDEVADLSARGQAKLLRVLQQHEVRRVGEAFSRKVDVRLVTAANRDMQTEAAEGRFRQDLLYRLDVIRIRVPALRDRPEDIAMLAEHFWQAAAARLGSAATLTHGLLAALTNYHWPGNVRQLQNVMAAVAVAAPSRGAVRPVLLPAAITGAATVTAVRLDVARAQFDRRCIEVALARAGGNRTKAAMQLGVSRQGLLKTMARLGIEAK